MRYNSLGEINLMIDRLLGFEENQIKLIKQIAEHAFTTGSSLSIFEDENIKLKIRVVDLEKIVETQNTSKKSEDSSKP